jgi:F-box and leucine-rich repeat protein 2/20
MRPWTANLEDERPGSSPAPHSGVLRVDSDIPEAAEGYFAQHAALPVAAKPRTPNPNFNFWKDMPHELKLSIFGNLKPKELVRASIVSRLFYSICFDGQLWTSFDASEFYTAIPAESLAKIVEAAGPFVKDLNLRGCVQVEHYNRADVVVKSCKNLINATLEGCRNFQRATLHVLLTNNQRLAHLNLTDLAAVNNGSCKIVSKSCPQLESFNVSWCSHMDSRGLKLVIAGCPKLRDVRAGEVRGFSGLAGLEVATALFKTNNLERLVLSGCSDITDTTLQTIMQGIDPEIDLLTNRPLVPPRKLRHLDLSRCTRLTDHGLESLTHNVPHLQGLQLSSCNLLTDFSLSAVVATTPHLTHLDLEEVSPLTNAFLSAHLAKSHCAPVLEHLSVSYCEQVGDAGLLPLIRAATSLHALEMDNTAISDLVLAEAVAMVRARSRLSPGDVFGSPASRPQATLRLVVFDCVHVTWTGVREILSRNAEMLGPPLGGHAREVVALKCYYGWQMTVDEHLKRVLRGEWAAAGRLERKWAEHMVANEEMGAGGAVAGARRRRRRARAAAMLHADEEEGGVGMAGIGRRRRARSNGCVVM